MKSSFSKKNFLWGYLAQFLNIGSGLILVPLLVHFMSEDDVGMWFVFLTLASLIQLLELGFQPTLARAISYIYAGARSLVTTGVPPASSNSKELDSTLLSQIIDASRFVYKRVSLITALTMFVGGSSYIWSILDESQEHVVTIIGWLLFASGYVLNFYYGYFNALLQGRGDIAQAYKVVVVTRCVFLLVSSILIILKFGLIGIGAASLISSAAGRVAARRWYLDKNRPESKLAFNMKADGKHLIKTLLPNATRIGFVQIGAFLINRTSLFMVTSYVGLAATASYGLTLNVLLAISSLASVITQSQVPRMSGLQVINNKTLLRKIYVFSLAAGLVTYISGAMLIVLFGEDLLKPISRGTNLLPVGQLSLFAIIIFFELNHTIAATYLTTINKVPFVNAAILSGITITVIDFIATPLYGVWGVLMVQGLVQLAYNNWKWPLEAAKHLELKWKHRIYTTT